MGNERTIMHLDMNAFFASVEQSANKFIRYKPVAVGNPGYDNSALVAVSYEARAKGVRNLSRAREARAICPDLLIVPFDPLKYYSVNRQIVSILREYTPLVEVYSVDEAFVDLTELIHLTGRSAVDIAQEIKDRLVAEVGAKLTSSVGIAPNKLLAKVGSDWKKPDGLTVITNENKFEFLDQLELMDIWGIGFRGGPKLMRLGINNTKQLRELSGEELRSIVGSYYTRLQAIANGLNYDPVSPTRNSRPHKSMQHAHTMSKATNDRDYLKTVMRKMAERLARRLRSHGQNAQVVYLGFKQEKQMEGYGWGSYTRFSDFESLPVPTSNGKTIYDAACRIFENWDLGDTKIRLVVVGIGNLHSANQLIFDMFTHPKLMEVDKAVDKINKTFGEFTIRTADILNQRAKESELRVDTEDMTFHPAVG